MIRVQLAISHLEDGHFPAVPVHARVIVVHEDGQPGDGANDGDGKDDRPEGSIERRSSWEHVESLFTPYLMLPIGSQNSPPSRCQVSQS